MSERERALIGCSARKQKSERVRLLRSKKKNRKKIGALVGYARNRKATNLGFKKCQRLVARKNFN